jgi:hypothetical protein
MSKLLIIWIRLWVTNLIWVAISSNYFAHSLEESGERGAVQKIIRNNEKDCSLECYFNENCVSWNYFPSERHCYLQSEGYHDLMRHYNLSLPTNSRTKDSLFRHKRVITGPVAIGRSTVLNTDQSFVFGCSYTISLWAWIYKVPKSAGEMALFTTRESLPNLRQYQALLPSIVFNLGLHKDRLFFSSIKDARNDYEGSWGPQIEFQEWIHLALSFVNDTMKVYLNGEEISSLIMTRQPEFPKQRCPEDLPGENFTRTTDQLNNTIFQIGGSKIGTMFGMVQNVDIFQGATLSQSQIQNLMTHYPPTQFPTLDLLLQKYEHHLHRSSTGTLSFTYSQSDELSDYELYNYNICPRSLCGTISLYDNEPRESELEEIETETETGIEEEEDVGIILDEDIYFDSENNVEFKVEFIQENSPDDDAPSSIDPQSSLETLSDGSQIDLLEQEQLWKEYVQSHEDGDDTYGFEEEEMSDEDLDALWSNLESGILENRDEYMDILRQIRGSDLGDPYQDMSDDEVLEMWNAQVASIAKEYLATSKPPIEGRRTTSTPQMDEQISKDLGQEWQDFSRSSQSLNHDKADTEMKSQSNATVPPRSKVIDEKLSTEAKRFISAAELKLNLEAHLRDPYYRRTASPMLKSLMQETEHQLSSQKNLSSDLATLDGLKNWVYLGYSQAIEYTQMTFLKLRHSILSTLQTQLNLHGLNVTIVDQEFGGNETKSDRNQTKIRELTEQMLSKLPNRNDFGPDQVELISDWLETFLAKQTEAGEDGLEAFAELLDSASFLILDPSMLKDSEKHLPPSVAIVTELYDQAMLWYAGRHLIDSYSVSNPSTSLVDPLSPSVSSTTHDQVPLKHQSFDSFVEQYHREVHEPAQSALMYAMWLSDILEMEYPDLADNTYFYQTMTGMFGQPIRLALGYRNVPNSIRDADTNFDMQESLRMIVAGSPEYLAIGRASSIELIQNVTSSKTNSSSESEEDSLEIVSEGTTSLEQFLDLLSGLENLDSDLSSRLESSELLNTLSHLPLSNIKTEKKSPHSLNQMPAHRDDECTVAGSYYLPIMKYVTSHFGEVETGVGIPDGVLLADLPSPDDIFSSMSTGGVGGGGGGAASGSGGVNSILESSLREHYEAEAAGGNPAAQMWMGIRSYWGTGGLPANSTNARKSVFSFIIFILLLSSPLLHTLTSSVDTLRWQPHKTTVKHSFVLELCMKMDKEV